MPCTTSDEKLDDGTVGCIIAPLPATPPTDDLHLVVIAMSNHVAAGICQSAHHIEMSARCSPVHWVGIVALLPEIGVQTTFEQQIHHCEMTLMRCKVQQRPFVWFVANV